MTNTVEAAKPTRGLSLEDLTALEDALRNMDDQLGRAQTMADTVNLLTQAVYGEGSIRVQSHGLASLVDMTPALVADMNEAVAVWESALDLVTRPKSAADETAPACGKLTEPRSTSDHRSAAYEPLSDLEPHINNARYAARVILNITSSCRDSAEPKGACASYVACHLLDHLEDLRRAWLQHFEAAGGNPYDGEGTSQ